MTCLYQITQSDLAPTTVLHCPPSCRQALLCGWRPSRSVTSRRKESRRNLSTRSLKCPVMWAGELGTPMKAMSKT